MRSRGESSNFHVAQLRIWGSWVRILPGAPLIRARTSVQRAAARKPRTSALFARVRALNCAQRLVKHRNFRCFQVSVSVCGAGTPTMRRTGGSQALDIMSNWDTKNSAPAKTGENNRAEFRWAAVAATVALRNRSISAGLHHFKASNTAQITGEHLGDNRGAGAQ